MAGGQLFAEDVDEQGRAVEERRRDAFERHLGGREIEGSRQGAAELAERLGRAEVGRAAAEVQASNRPSGKAGSRLERLLDLPHHVVDDHGRPCET